MAGRPAQHIGAGGGIMLRKDGEDWKRCREFNPGTCASETDGCCAVIPCTLCISWVGYGETQIDASASWTGAQWQGTVGPITFVAYWERSYGVCQFVVEANGEEVYREDLCEYASVDCRNVSGEADVSQYNIEGVLGWSTYEPRELPRITGDNGCADHFCSECDCICNQLCVTISRVDSSPLDAYDIPFCFGRAVIPVNDQCDYYGTESDRVYWSGTVTCGTDYDVLIELTRDEYTGRCQVQLTADGAEFSGTYDKKLVGCPDFEVTWEIDEYTTVTASCVPCGKCDSETGSCCAGRCLPGEACDNPMPSSLDIEVTMTPNYTPGGSETVDANCFDSMTGTLDFKTPAQGGVNCWEGEVSGSCTWCSQTANLTATFRLCCDGDGENFTLSIAEITSSTCVPTQSQTVAKTSCDLLLISDCLDEELTACFVGCLVDVYVEQPPSFTVCVTISEAP